MDCSTLFSTSSRREFLKKAALLGSLGFISHKNIFAFNGSIGKTDGLPDIFYKYKTMSVDHFPKLQKDIETLKRKGLLSRNKIFKGYIEDMTYELPENFTDAKSIIIMAAFTRSAIVKFHWHGKKYDVIIPPQYYDSGISIEDLKKVIQKDIIESSGYKIENTTTVHLKQLAVRSGLGRYGRNNLCYVKGMGTFITLYAFLTNFQFEDDHWTSLNLLDACRTCPICYGICPTNCIKKENFVINVGKCITLYNEINGNFPNWILPSMHNALIGCIKCQYPCPENEKFIPLAERLEDVTESETHKILNGKPDEKLLASLSQKLKKFIPATSKEYFPIFTRNLRALIR
ncbi:MAG: hypothetical protein GTO17_05395 [Candidatus Aminicenantes bacterium]|nr:hypothetical protein [Candidatus Aminicenantes bacterium]